MRVILLLGNPSESRSKLSKRGVWTSHLTDTDDFFAWSGQKTLIPVLMKKAERLGRDLYILVPWKSSIKDISAAIKCDVLYLFIALDDVEDSPSDLAYYTYALQADARECWLEFEDIHAFYLSRCEDFEKKNRFKSGGLKEMMDTNKLHYTAVNRIDVELSAYSPKVDLFHGMKIIGELDIHIRDPFGMAEMARIYAEYRNSDVLIESCRIYFWDDFFKGQISEKIVEEPSIQISRMLDTMKQRSMENDIAKNDIPGAGALFTWNKNVQENYSDMFFVARESTYEDEFCNVSITEDGIHTIHNDVSSKK